MSGYSGKNLIDKLGIKPGMNAIVMRPPAGYLDLMPDFEEQANVTKRLSRRMDFLQYFATSPEQLGAVMPNLAAHLEPGGMLWICWVKQASPKNTGLTERIVRELGLKAGLVDVKVASVTDEWSGLKFVYRVSDR